MPTPFEEAFNAAAEELGHNPDEITGVDLIAGNDENDDVEDDDTQSDEDQEDEVEDEEGNESEESDEDTEDDPDDEEDEEGTDDPEAKGRRYFKIDLSDVPEEVRGKVLSELKDKDRYITRQQQEKSALEKEVEELRGAMTEFMQLMQEPETPEVEMPSDEELIQHITQEFGLDPEDPFYEVQVKAALPGVKASLQTQAVVESQQEELAVLRFHREYTGQLSKLEADSGRLPISHDDFIQWAAENDFGDDPVPAYEAFMQRAEEIVGGGGKPKPKPKKADDPKRKEAKRAAKKAASTGSRKPAGRTKPAPKETASIEDAISAAIEESGWRP